MRLITDYKDNLLLIDEGTRAIGDDFVWDTDRVKFVCSEDESTTVDKKIIAASPKLGDLPLLPELPKQEEDVEQLMYEAIDYTLQCANGYQEGNYEVSFMYPANNIAYQKLLKAKERYKAESKKWSDEDMVAFAIHTWDTGESTLEILKKWKRTLSPTSPIGFEPEYEESKEYEIKPLPTKPYEGMKVLRDGKIGTVNMYSGKTDGSWTWALIKEFGYWNPPELKQVIFKKKLKIVNGVLQGRWIYG